MDISTLRERLTERAPELEQQLGELVRCESPSDDLPALGRCAELLAGWGDAALRRRGESVLVGGQPHLLWRAQRPNVLILGHFDTVWPIGTIDEWPFTVQDGVARGPGVFDMKAGIVQAFAALEALADVSSVAVLLTSDEEPGQSRLGH